MHAKQLTGDSLPGRDTKEGGKESKQTLITVRHDKCEVGATVF